MAAEGGVTGSGGKSRGVSTPPTPPCPGSEPRWGVTPGITSGQADPLRPHQTWTPRHPWAFFFFFFFLGCKFYFLVWFCSTLDLIDYRGVWESRGLGASGQLIYKVRTRGFPQGLEIDTQGVVGTRAPGPSGFETDSEQSPGLWGSYRCISLVAEPRVGKGRT